MLFLEMIPEYLFCLKCRRVVITPWVVSLDGQRLPRLRLRRVEEHVVVVALRLRRRTLLP